MSPDAWITVAVVVLMLIALVRELAPPDVAVMGALVTLILLGVVPIKEALQGFSNQALVTVAALVIVAQSLQNTGALEGLARRVFGQERTLRGGLVRIMSATATMSAFLNNTPIVAMFMPLVLSWSRRTGISPSQLLIPLSYASILGGVCTLIGTSTNLIVNGLLIERGFEPFSMWDFAPVGIPVAAVGLGFVLLTAGRLLPRRSDLLNLAQEQRKEYMLEMRLEPSSPLVGLSVEEAGLRQLPGLFLVHLEREERVIAPVDPSERLGANDRLSFAGVIDTIKDLQKFRGLVPDLTERSSTQASSRLAEVVVSSSSPLVGKTVRDANFRGRYNAAVIAIHRHGERIGQKIGEVELHPGDTLLLEAAPGFARTFRNSRDFFLVSEVEESESVRHHLALVSSAILAAVVLLATFDVMPMVIAALAGAVACAVAGCITPPEARRTIDPGMLMVIAASLGIAAAMERTGAARAIADLLSSVGSGFGPVGVLGSIFVATVILTELITNNAAAALMFPIALSAAQATGVPVHTFALAVAIAASCSFATPLGYQTNMMVYGPGSYRFTDFLRIGLPIQILVAVTALTALSLSFPG